jgi:hypothetical protein
MKARHGNVSWINYLSLTLGCNWWLYGWNCKKKLLGRSRHPTPNHHQQGARPLCTVPAPLHLPRTVETTPPACTRGAPCRSWSAAAAATSRQSRSRRHGRVTTHDHCFAPPGGPEGGPMCWHAHTGRRGGQSRARRYVDNDHINLGDAHRTPRRAHEGRLSPPYFLGVTDWYMFVPYRWNKNI